MISYIRVTLITSLRILVKLFKFRPNLPVVLFILCNCKILEISKSLLLGVIIPRSVFELLCLLDQVLCDIWIFMIFGPSAVWHLLDWCLWQMLYCFFRVSWQPWDKRLHVPTRAGLWTTWFWTMKSLGRWGRTSMHHQMKVKIDLSICLSIILSICPSIQPTNQPPSFIPTKQYSSDSNSLYL